MQLPAIVFPRKQFAELGTYAWRDVGPNDVRVETTMSLISIGTESFCYRGEFEPNTTWAGWVKYPFYPGYSTVGVVAEKGGEVKHLNFGDRVFVRTCHSAGAVVAGDAAVRIPDNVTDEAAGLGALATVTQTGIRRAEHTMGDTAVVIGLGPLGQLVTQYLRVLGLRRIIAVDTAPARLAFAKSHGATDTFEGSAADAVAFVKACTDGMLADVVYDMTGHWAVLPLALKLARQFGKVMLIGDTPEPTRQHLTQDVLARQVSIIGSHNEKLQPQYAHWSTRRQCELFFDYLSRGMMKTGDLVTHRFKPADANDAYQLLATKRSDVMGLVFDWK
jgi:2-desacetyl-2-hydroxyethyl bacteriochlorophyllide A dehydrogenase